MESTQTSLMFILLTETEEANLSGGQSTVTTNGAPGQSVVGQSVVGKNGVSVQNGAALNGVSGRNAVYRGNVQRPERITTIKARLERLLSRLESIRER